MLFLLAGVASGLVGAEWYVRPRTLPEHLATVVLALATMGCATWLVGQGDEYPLVVVPVAGSLTFLCSWGLRRSRRRHVRRTA